MKIFTFGFALLALASAALATSPSVEYLPPVEQELTEGPQFSSVSLPSSEYLAPVGQSFQTTGFSSGAIADDGYRYKTVKRYRLRHRRDVSELPSSEYLPPVQQVSVGQVAPQYVSQVSTPQVSFPQVSSVSVPSNEYLAPVGPSIQTAAVSSGVLADDGYRYKTVKRYRLRHRRDVSELPSSEYLPPVQQVSVPQVAPQYVSQISTPQVSFPQVSSVSVPSNEYLAPVGPSIQTAAVSSGVLADDGYRYKTVKRYRLRHRRDVSELPSSEYLPPVQQVSVPQVAPQYVSQVSTPQVSFPQVSSVSVPSNEYLAPVGPSIQTAAVSSGVLADDGYRYKTVKRYRLRHRRDVSELPSSEYLPPVQQVSVPQVSQQFVSQVSTPQVSFPQVSSVSVPSNEYLAPVGPSIQTAAVSSGVLADDGYRYKTVKRYRLRHRRDVSELPSSEYLPPVQQVSVPEVAPQYVSRLSAPQVSSISVPSNEYLAPVGQSFQTTGFSSGAIADDGYRYKTVKRYRLRHRRDVSELPSSEYLPPVQQQVFLPQQSSFSSLGSFDVAPLQSNVLSGGLSDDGYRYKTVRKIRRRH